MRGSLALVSGAGLGAGLMYLLDPERGERRRARLGDVMNDATDRLASPDVLSSLREAGSRFGSSDVVSDVVSNVRDAGARLATSGVLSGVRRAGARLDAPRLVSELASVARDARGMRPTWRKGRLTLRRRSFLDEHRWSLLGVAAGMLAAGVWGLWRREPGAVRESVTVAASPERVYDVWSRFENFPRFMPVVREVRPTGVDRNHWVINGPAGAPIEFDSVVTRREPPNSLAWRTVEGALVSHGGTARFRPAGVGQTRVDVMMWWRPAAGGIGEGVATLAGMDPSHVLREGLDRFKAELEQGRHAANR